LTRNREISDHLNQNHIMCEVDKRYFLQANEVSSPPSLLFSNCV